MNREEILQIEAGRELDALVARLVFGAESWCPDQEDEYDLICTCERGPSRTWHQKDPLPHFSTDDAAACEVMDKLYDDGWVVDVGSLALVPRGWRSHMVNMFCDDFHRQPKYVEASADTRPLAICRAALLAVMEEA